MQEKPSLQVIAVPAWQFPLTHVSAPLQYKPSLHEVLSGTLVWTQPSLVSHPSVVQGLPSSHAA